jgi:hypothetical protein
MLQHSDTHLQQQLVGKVCTQAAALLDSSPAETPTDKPCSPNTPVRARHDLCALTAHHQALNPTTPDLIAISKQQPHQSNTPVLAWH